MHPALEQLEHRPWPLPAGRWTWRQSWCDLLFAHWPVDPEPLASLIPAPLRLQTFDGAAWLGVVPFRMEGVMRRPFPDMPGISAFPEINLRTYVEYDGKPGVWFLSLDATNPLAVRAARWLFHLPYFRARISLERRADGFDYVSARTRGPAARFEARYGPTGAAYAARPGTLEHFLTERYCLYARSRRDVLFRTEVHHVAWPLQPAQADVRVNTLSDSHGIVLRGEAPVLHFAARVDVVVWSPERLLERA